MDKTWDLRKILSQNIKSIRQTLHISQANLAEYAGISLPYLADIERCRTWVSDKTLQNLANALNKEPWELLIQSKEEKHPSKNQKLHDVKTDQIRHIADVIAKKKEILRRVVNKTMEELIIEILQNK